MPKDVGVASKTKNMKKNKTQQIINSLRDLNPIEIVGVFRAYAHRCAPGSYAAAVLRFSPEDGAVDVIQASEASWAVTADEYFEESGRYSDRTLLSDSNAGSFFPGPDDGFEWEDAPAGEYFRSPDSTEWKSEDEAAACEEEAHAAAFESDDSIPDGTEFTPVTGDAGRWAKKHGWVRFIVSSTPFTGWVPQGAADPDVESVELAINELIEAI